LYFVDLPGYGYAKVSKAQKASWDEMIETYLHSRTQLKSIIMLVDIRHTPSDNDQMMYNWILSRSMPVVVVASKADKIPRSQLQNRLRDITATLEMPGAVLPIPFSAITGQGKDDIWKQIIQKVF
jgi:GTP-binding protein